jgi:hypothetical protein
MWSCRLYKIQYFSVFFNRKLLSEKFYALRLSKLSCFLGHLSSNNFIKNKYSFIT